jgi:hypothetical protein
MGGLHGVVGKRSLSEPIERKDRNGEAADGNSSRDRNLPVVRASIIELCSATSQRTVGECLLLAQTANSA